jgi:hypothetical protein
VILVLLVGAIYYLLVERGRVIQEAGAPDVATGEAAIA